MKERRLVGWLPGWLAANGRAWLHGVRAVKLPAWLVSAGARPWRKSVCLHASICHPLTAA